MMKRIMRGVALGVMLGCLLTGCGGMGTDTKVDPDDVMTGTKAEKAGNGDEDIELVTDELEEELKEFAGSIRWEKIHVRIPGMQGEKKLLYVSDLHLITESEGISPDRLPEIRTREEYFSYDGISSADSWPVWADYLNLIKNDGILFGADMVDFCSQPNVECLKKGLDRLDCPWLYVRADHDYSGEYLSDGADSERQFGLQKSIDGSDADDVISLEYEDFLVVGWNNSTEQLTESGLEMMRELFSKGKPVILLTHVPIRPLKEEEAESLAEASKQAWNDRVLIWGNPGKGCFYEPDETTQEFLQMIYDDNTPVVEILCGHLHLSWDGYVTPMVHQHVFSAAFDRYAGVVTISGK